MKRANLGNMVLRVSRIGLCGQRTRCSGTAVTGLDDVRFAKTFRLALRRAGIDERRARRQRGPSEIVRSPASDFGVSTPRRTHVSATRRYGPSGSARQTSRQRRPCTSPRRRPVATRTRKRTRACSRQARASRSASATSSSRARSMRPISAGVRIRQRRRGSRGRSTTGTGFALTSGGRRFAAATNSSFRRFRWLLIVRGPRPSRRLRAT